MQHHQSFAKMSLGDLLPCLSDAGTAGKNKMLDFPLLPAEFTRGFLHSVGTHPWFGREWSDRASCRVMVQQHERCPAQHPESRGRIFSCSCLIKNSTSSSAGGAGPTLPSSLALPLSEQCPSLASSKTESVQRRTKALLSLGALCPSAPGDAL